MAMESRTFIDVDHVSEEEAEMMLRGVQARYGYLKAPAFDLSNIKLTLNLVKSSDASVELSFDLSHYNGEGLIPFWVLVVQNFIWTIINFIFFEGQIFFRG